MSEKPALVTNHVKRALAFLQIAPDAEFLCVNGCPHTAQEYLESAFHAYSIKLLEQLCAEAEKQDEEALKAKH